MPGHGPYPSAPAQQPAAPAPSIGMGPAPRINVGLPAPNLAAMSNPGMGGMGAGNASMGGAGVSSMGGMAAGMAGMAGHSMGSASSPHHGAGGHYPSGGAGFPGGMGVSAPAPVSAPMGGPPSKSTAPTASAAPVVDGMPVAWPLPTKTQSKLSTTQSVAAANAAIQEMSAGGGNGAVTGDIMPAHDLTYVRNVLTMLLDASSQDGNMKKREDISKRLDELFGRLETGRIKTAASQKVMAMVKAVEAQDLISAQKLQLELCTIDWEVNKNWLLGVKRLIPSR